MLHILGLVESLGLRVQGLGCMFGKLEFGVGGLGFGMYVWGFRLGS